MHRLHPVYNTIDDSPPIIHLIICCVAFVLIVCFCITMYSGIGRNATVRLSTGDKVNPFLFILVPVTIGFLIFLHIDILDINVYQQDKAIFNSRQFKVVEGRVTDFHPMPGDGHGNEYFYVDSIGFAYSKYEEAIGGYHKTSLDGGVIKANLYVRISYYPTDFRNIILKLETE